jgi:glycosyltransferase involved in cell wall biosynthesis
MSRPLVSIAIPTYNRCAMLRTALLSAQAQTYDPIEIVVSDNASTDDTAEMVREMAREDDRIRLFVNETNIESLNFLKVIGACRGEYVKFLNDDDLLLPHAVERMVQPMEDPRVGLSFARQDWMDAEGVPMTIWDLAPAQQWWARYADFGSSQILSGTRIGDFSLTNTINAFGCHSAHLFRREDVPLERFGMLNGRRFHAPADFAHALQLAAGRDVAYTHESTVHIRVHEGQSHGLKAAALQLITTMEWLDIVLSAPSLGYLSDPRDRVSALKKVAVLLARLEQLEEPGDDAGRVAHGLARIAAALQDLNEASLQMEERGGRLTAPLDWPAVSHLRRLLAQWTRDGNPSQDELVLLVDSDMLAVSTVLGQVEATLREHGRSLESARVGIEAMPPLLT